MLVIMCVSDESDSDTDVPRGKVLAAALHLHPGHFSCDCMWQTHFVLHPRLKSSGSSAPRSTISPGWHIASQSVLMALFCWYFLHCYYMHHFTCGISFLLWSISLILFTLLWFISSYKHHLFSVPILTLNISCSASWASHCILTTAWPHITVTCPCSPRTLCHVKSIRHHHHHLSLPQPFIPDLKLICFTNPFFHSLTGSIWTTFMDLGLGLVGTGVCFSFFFLYFLFLVACATLSWWHSASTLHFF